jgi:hypothetical protein
VKQVYFEVAWSGDAERTRAMTRDLYQPISHTAVATDRLQIVTNFAFILLQSMVSVIITNLFRSSC